MAKIEKPNMLTRLKNKMTHKGRDKYMIFSGNEENFVRNGAWLLEESIALFHGKANPVRHLSVDDLNNMNVERLSCYSEGNLYQGSWEGRVVLVKKHQCRYDCAERILREIVVATQMATHNNAHKILGCCLETDLPVFVYEWMPNTLQDRICPNYANQSKAVLEWKDRLRIAWEISHVAAYLHTAFPRPIIHRDLKPHNVFLNQDNAVKLGDFSFCVSIPEGEEFIKVDKILGTFGYLAPEHSMKCKVAKSTDVFSFGMLFLVLLTGKRPYFFSRTEEEELDIISWVRNGVKNNHVNKIVDPTITRNGVTSIEDLQLRASAQLAIRCLSEEEDCRPTMVEVATELKNMIRSLEV
ncbi:non-functional pseudokinase ZED1-like [Chenopodium quinoa]|uniref:non-functional pseudokinase ZED1-like n=1 Tax=Chenopodium quinoa TaxID=63459 RepID=UPI000B7988CB|nr:non-functional pseudokinase ZED1-like [Chenopodium quinoa]